MSTIVATGHQIGLHSNTLNNFTWFQPNTPNGSVVFGHGNYGNTVTLLTVSNTAFTFSTNTTFSGISTFSANVVLSGGLVANGSVGSNGQVLTSNGSTSYWATSSAATTGKAIAMAIVFGG